MKSEIKAITTINNLIFILLSLTFCNLYGQQVVAQENYYRQQHHEIENIPVSLRKVASLPSFIVESSGIQLTTPNEIWTHEDSRTGNEIFCLDTTGSFIRAIKITNARNIDWEDMTIDNSGNLYIADIGNNRNRRRNLCIYRIPTPGTIKSDKILAEKISFVYEDQASFPPKPAFRNFDAEAIIWHDDSIFIFTKNRTRPFTGYCKLYKIPARPGSFTAQLVDSVFTGSNPETSRITAADINRSTGTLVLLTASGLIAFSDYSGNNFFRGKRMDYVFTIKPGQVEAIAFISPQRLYITEEYSGHRPAYLYEVVLPER